MVQGFKGRSTGVGDDGSDGGRRRESRNHETAIDSSLSVCSSVEAATATLSALKERKFGGGQVRKKKTDDRASR